jgi:hypothetical protein
MSQTYNGGISLTYPKTGERNWSSVLDKLVQKISDHDHTGNGNGHKLGIQAMSNNMFDGDNFRLDSGQWLRSRNAANNGDVNLIRANASDQVEFGTQTLNVPAAAGGITLNALGNASPGGNVLSINTFNGATLKFSETVTEAGIKYLYPNGTGTYRIDTNAISPLTDNAVDLGTTTAKFRTGYFSTLASDSVTAKNVNFAQTSGTANAIVLTLSPPISSYTPGMVIGFKAASTNSAAVTVKVDSQAVVNLQSWQDGTIALGKGDLVAGGTYYIQYVSAGVGFQMYNQPAKANNLRYWAGNAGGTKNALVLNTVPRVTSLQDGMVVSFRAVLNNDAAVTADVNGTGALSVRVWDSVSTPLSYAEICGEGIYELVYNAASNIWQMCSSGVTTYGWNMTFGGNISSGSKTYARYKLAPGRVMFIWGQFTGTGTGALITVNIPTAPASGTFNVSGMVGEAGVYYPLSVIHSGGPDVLNFRKPGSAAFSGALTITFSGVYES